MNKCDIYIGQPTDVVSVLFDETERKPTLFLNPKRRGGKVLFLNLQVKAEFSLVKVSMEF